MKKLFLIFTVLFLSVGNANAWYIVDDTTKGAWGNPSIAASFIQDSTGGVGSFRIDEGWACCNASNNTGNMATYGRSTVADDQAILAFIAQKMVARGGYFCLTQIHVASGPSGFWTIYQQPSWPKLQCAWFCEPGYEGENCTATTSAGAACDTIEYTMDNIKNKRGGNDQILASGWRPSVEGVIPMFYSNFQFGFYEHDVILGATDFLMHGINARPITLGAVGDHPAKTILTSQPTTGGSSKLLCAQGFSGPDCAMSSSNCGKDVWCTGFDKFDSNKHTKITKGSCNQYRCIGGKALSASDNTSCVDCTESIKGGIDSGTGKCISCASGEFFDNSTGKCKTAKVYSKSAMQFGSGGSVTTDTDKQCWTKENPKEFLKCISGK